MSYEQAMKHSRNHRKDRFVQQCSGYAGNGASETTITEEKRKQYELETFARLKEIPEEAYPIYIVNSGSWYWNETAERNLFSTRIEIPAELEQFGKDIIDL